MRAFLRPDGRNVCGMSGCAWYCAGGGTATGCCPAAPGVGAWPGAPACAPSRAGSAQQTLRRPPHTSLLVAPPVLYVQLLSLARCVMLGKQDVPGRTREMGDLDMHKQG